MIRASTSFLFSLQKIPNSRPGIESLLVSLHYIYTVCPIIIYCVLLKAHPFLKLHESDCEETISSWVTKSIEQMRLTMKRFPSDLSLASTSSTHSTGGRSNSSRVTAGSTSGGVSGIMGGAGTSGSSLGNSSSQRLSMGSSGLTHSSGVEFMETQ